MKNTLSHCFQCLDNSLQVSLLDCPIVRFSSSPETQQYVQQLSQTQVKEVLSRFSTLANV